MSEARQRSGALGEAGETCRECGAALAVDQRYCLNCGRRRAGPRVNFREHLPADDAGAQNGAAPATPLPAAAPSAAERPQRDYAPLAAVGGIAVLGLMLLVGVLIGKGDSGTASAPPPQVVRVGGGGAGETASDEGDRAEGGASKQAKKAEGSGTGAKGAGAKAASAPVEASDDALQELQEQSPEEYQDSSAKLPDEIATGGAPPPTDDKAPGGGSKGTAIE